MLVHHRVTQSRKFTGTHSHTVVEKDTVRVKCLAQKHSTMSTPPPARAQSTLITIFLMNFLAHVGETANKDREIKKCLTDAYKKTDEEFLVEASKP